MPSLACAATALARVAVRYDQPSHSDRRRAQKIAGLAPGVLFVIGGEQGFHTAEPSIERDVLEPVIQLNLPFLWL
jgi:hypothetical protein